MTDLQKMNKRIKGWLSVTAFGSLLFFFAFSLVDARHKNHLPPELIFPPDWSRGFAAALLIAVPSLVLGFVCLLWYYGREALKGKNKL